MKIFMKFFLIALLIVSLPGCATHKKISKTDQIKTLETEVSALQGELDRKNMEIESLEKKAASKSTHKVKSSTSSKAGSASWKLTSREIQTALKNAGFYAGAIDGKIGKMTKKGIKEFQAANGLAADGVVGKKTSAALRQHLKEDVK